MRVLAILVAVFTLAACLEPDPPQEWRPPAYSPVNPVQMNPQFMGEDREVFPDGVMAGDPLKARMLLWTRTTRQTRVRLKVWIPDIDPQNPGLVDLIHDQPATVADGGYVHQFVDTVPGLRHGYAFFAGAAGSQGPANSRVGYFTAAPPAGALTRLTLAGTHGTNERFAPYPNLVKNAEFEPFTLYLHMGDSIYADRAHTLDEYREFWRANRQTEGFRAVLAEAVYLPIWDDHEVTNNYDPETLDPQRLRDALDAFFEANPVGRDPAAPYRCWRSWKWGDTVEFFVLDVRSERRPSTGDDPWTDPPTISDDPIFISPAQLAWFKQALLDSSATFKLVLNSVPISHMPNPPWLNVTDTWMGYTRQRSQVIDFLLENAIENVYFLSGDFHNAQVGRLDPPGGPAHNLWEFIIGPGSQSNPLGDREAFLEFTSGQYDPLPPNQFLWAYPTAVLSYIDLDPLADPPVMTLRYYEPDGADLYTLTFAGGQPLEPY